MAIFAPMSFKYSCVVDMALLKLRSIFSPLAYISMSSAYRAGTTPASYINMAHGRMAIAAIIMERGSPWMMLTGVLYGLPNPVAMVFLVTTVSWNFAYASNMLLGIPIMRHSR